MIAAIQDKKLLPIAELDRGFVRPEYPAQVIVSYFQAGRICDYIQSRWGAQKLLDMVHSFAERKTTPDVIRQHLGMEPEQFDREFQAWLDKELGSTVANFDKWTAHLKELAAMAKADKNDEVIQQGDEVIRDVSGLRRTAPTLTNSWRRLTWPRATSQAAATVLKAYQTHGGRNPEALKQLASLELELGDGARRQPRWIASTTSIPEDEQLHRRLGDLWFAQKNFPGAIREFGAVLALKPLDRVSAEYDLARAYFAAGQREQARDHVLTALENAPSYRPAQQLLLQLEDADKGR